MAITEAQLVNQTTTTSTQPKTVAETIVKQLSLWGVKHIYGVVGDAILHLMEAIDQQSEITYIATRHESAAAFMASTEGKCTSRLGVCIGTSGPGLVNMLNGIADASADKVPLLVITGQVETKKIGTETKQYVEQQQMIAPLAVYSASLTHPEATVDVLLKAIVEAYSKKGVAHVSVPKDMFNKVCPVNSHPPVGVLQQESIKEWSQLDRAATRIASSRKPIILIGEGSRNSSEQVRSFAHAIQAGIIESLGAKGVVPYAEPLHLGGIGEGGTEESRELLLQSDCVIVIGANWWPEGFVPKQPKIVQIDTASVSIEAHAGDVLGLVGKAEEVLPLLQETVRQQIEQFPTEKQSRQHWVATVQETKQKINSTLEQEREGVQQVITPQRLIASIDKLVQEDAIMVIDTGDHTIWFNRIFQAKAQQVLYSGKWRTMGFALPSAIAAQLIFPQRQVVAIVGDGGLGMSIMELATAVRYHTPITVIVANNQSLSMEKNKMITEQITPHGVELNNPDFAALARSFGLEARRVTDGEELTSALQQALSTSLPYLLDVHISDQMPPLTNYASRVETSE